MSPSVDSKDCHEREPSRAVGPAGPGGDGLEVGECSQSGHGDRDKESCGDKQRPSGETVEGPGGDKGHQEAPGGHKKGAQGAV